MKKYLMAVLLVIGFISNLFSQTDSTITNQKVKSNLDSGKSTHTKGRADASKF